MTNVVKALHVKADNSIHLVEVDAGDGDAVRELVGGWLEGTFGDGWHVFYDEEALMKHSPPNRNAFALMMALQTPRPLLGDVIFFGTKNKRDGSQDSKNVPVHIIDKAKELELLDVDAFEDYAG
jgi:hypothetical protein